MDTTASNSVAGTSDCKASATANQLNEIASLLERIDGAVRNESSALNVTRAPQNDLAQVRLGIASGLFAALRGKHEPTAEHCLRVALGCSTWAARIGLPTEQRDEIELAAILHDIGKIGVADSVLLKPGALSVHELAQMDAHWQTGLEILRSCCSSPAVLEIVRYARSWYDGSKHRQELLGDQIPLGARMLAICDAFDAMMSDHVYRRALPLERAYNELYTNAGKQFDPALVVLFIKLHDLDGMEPSPEILRHWLHDLSPDAVNAPWKRREGKLSPTTTAARSTDDLFYNKLLDNMHDAVVFVDNNKRITLWNRGAERLTGIPASSVHQRHWIPSLVKMRDERGRLVKDEECPVAHALETGVQWLRRLIIRGRGGHELAVDAHAAPVMAADGTRQGLTLIFHDASSETSLEERCQNLHELATRDPLTGVANRAEFNRVIMQFVAAHLESKRPCSLIMCDIDRFKQINDRYGHPAGDAVIRSFAHLLQNAVRTGDLVSRYGGEEFTMLCADCDLASVNARAEEIRMAFAQLPQSDLEGRCVSASFGVTEVQPGDTADSLLARADRALLIAKETGRNRVVQLGSGSGGAHDDESPTKTLLAGGDILLSQELMTQSPIDRTIDKLHGFVADHQGEVVAIEGNEVQIRLGNDESLFRRKGDRQVTVLMNLRMIEEHPQAERGTSSGLTRTRIKLEIRPAKSRDRRKAESIERAKQMLISLRSYMMATEVSARVQATPEPERGFFGNIKAIFITPPPVDDR
ncbi:MAG: diguanylate cyclase [Planctomycetes bacterium]|nr:diguanylate cyclase [Planctomycetota bacterium]